MFFQVDLQEPGGPKYGVLVIQSPATTPNSEINRAFQYDLEQRPPRSQLTHAHSLTSCDDQAQLTSAEVQNPDAGVVFGGKTAPSVDGACDVCSVAWNAVKRELALVVKGNGWCTTK